MPEILVKEFSDIACSAGIQKHSKIKKEKNKPPYQPAVDYYKQLRESIIDCHQSNLGIAHVLKVANQCINPAKKPKFLAIAKAYSKWLSKNTYSWITPGRHTFNPAGFGVIINPELGLMISGKQTFVKLYFNQDPISQDRANFILFLMELMNKGIDCCVLDIRKSKLLRFKGNASVYASACTAELSYIASVWPTV